MVKEWFVIGLWEGNENDRYADVYPAETPEDAEELAHAFADLQGSELFIAAVLDPDQIKDPMSLIVL